MFIGIDVAPETEGKSPVGYPGTRLQNKAATAELIPSENIFVESSNGDKPGHFGLIARK
jgi:hypothetical protein